jgi:hypothetical protein
LYPRWSAYAQQGYGAPIPHYYPPGPAYAAALVEVLFTNNAVVAVRVLYVAAFGLASVALYGLVRRHAGARAGFIAAVLLAFSPYFGHTAPYILGDLPAVTGVALVAALLWRVDNLLWANSPQDTVSVGLATWALVLTHPPLAAAGLTAATLLTLYALTQRGRSIPWTYALLSAILGIGMAAFYWLPAVAEQSAITWRARPQAVAARATMEMLFSPLPFIDLAELVPRPQLTLGSVPAVIAALGTAAAVAARRAAGFHLLFLIYGMLSAATALLLPTQTWLVGLAALCAAISGSGIVTLERWLPARVQRLLTPTLLVVILVGSASVWLAPRWPETFDDLSPAAQFTYEQQEAGIAVLPPGASLPTTLSAAAPALTSADIANRVVRASGLQATVIQRGTHSLRIQISTDVPQRVNLLTAYFPGWQAWAEGNPLMLTPDPATNLIQIQVPPMTGEVTLSLGPTLPRQRGWLVSLGALTALVALTWLQARRSQPSLDDTPLLPTPEARLLAMTVAVSVLLIPLFAAPFSPLTLHARPGYQLDGAISLRDRTDAGLEAIAFRLDQPVYHPDDDIELTLYWRALRYLTENYQVQVSLYDVTRGILRYRTTLRPPGDYPTRRWQPYQYVTDVYRLPLSPELPPDDYQITVEVYACRPVCDANSRLSFFDSAGRPHGQTLNLPVYARIVPAGAFGSGGEIRQRPNVG